MPRDCRSALRSVRHVPGMRLIRDSDGVSMSFVFSRHRHFALRGLTLVVGVMGLLALAAPVFAQGTFGPWSMVCRALGPGETRCALVQRQIEEGTNRLGVEFQIGGLEEGQVPLVAVTAPLGVWLASGVSVIVDDRPEQTASFVTCIAQGCTARFEDVDLVDNLIVARELRVSFATGPGDDQRFETRISLIGLREGVSAIRGTEPVAE